MTGVVLRAGAATDVGRLRTINQDSFLLLPDRDLFIVADGMGGHQGGEVASRLAVETLQTSYRDPTADALTDAIAIANDRIRHEGDADPDLHGMGTTVVALALLPEEPDPDELADEREHPQHLLIANVGDSRGYLFRDGSLTQLTEDHSVVADLVRDGRITTEEAEVHPQRNIVTRVLGVYDTVDVDLWPVDPVVRDRYLLCSDGLFNEVGADQISSVLRRLDDPNEAAAELVRLANESGGRDNITAVIVDVLDDGGVAETASAALAGQPSGVAAGPPAAPGDRDDLAGFTTAMPATGRGELSDDQLDSVLSGRPSRKERREERRRRRSQRTRLTWRVLLFTVLVLGVIGGALATIQWYGTSTYFVAFEGDEVVIFQGRPGGILWVDPELEERTGIDRADVPPRYVPGILAGNEQPSLAKAREHVANIERDIDALEADPGTSTTSTTSGDGSTTSSTAGTTTTRAN
jgi:serine/threonine protein phosphatase PrpC